jgi:hypothetical protein
MTRTIFCISVGLFGVSYEGNPRTPALGASTDLVAGDSPSGYYSVQFARIFGNKNAICIRMPHGDVPVGWTALP